MIKGEFIGFSFNGKHSSDFNIVRVSEGSRFKEDLIPAFQDKTVAVPGGDGSYLFGTNYTQRTRTISFAYDNLTEEKLVALRRWLAAGEIGELILDEWPYKAWDVKVSAPPSLNFVPFDNGPEGKTASLIHNHNLGEERDFTETTTSRHYKGEGTISFIAYQPFAHNPKGKKWKGDYTEKEKGSAWMAASGLSFKDPWEDNLNNGYDTFLKSIPGFKVYNAGDLPCDFNLIFTPVLTADTPVTISGANGQLKFTVPEKYSGTNFRVNTKLHLIEGVEVTKIEGTEGEEEVVEIKVTGDVYNNWITGGDFFKLPLGESQVTIKGLSNIIIEYNYRYL